MSNLSIIQGQEKELQTLLTEKYGNFNKEYNPKNKSPASVEIADKLFDQFDDGHDIRKMVKNNGALNTAVEIFQNSRSKLFDDMKPLLEGPLAQRIAQGIGGGVTAEAIIAGSAQVDQKIQQDSIKFSRDQASRESEASMRSGPFYKRDEEILASLKSFGPGLLKDNNLGKLREDLLTALKASTPENRGKALFDVLQQATEGKFATLPWETRDKFLNTVVMPTLKGSETLGLVEAGTFSTSKLFGIRNGIKAADQQADRERLSPKRL